MIGSRYDDYLMRETRAVAAIVARIMGLRVAGKEEQARAALEEALAGLLGPQEDLVRRLDAATAALMLASPEKVLALARLTAEEAEQEEDAGRGARLRSRALELALEAMLMRPDDREAVAVVVELARFTDPSGLAPERRRLLEEILARH